MTRNSRWWALALAASLSALVLLAGAAGAAFCAATLHVKRLTGPVPTGATRIEILARDRAKLVGWWFPSAAANGGCVVVLHGIGDSKVSSAGFAPMFLAKGYSVLAPDSRAHGRAAAST